VFFKKRPVGFLFILYFRMLLLQNFQGSSLPYLSLYKEAVIFVFYESVHRDIIMKVTNKMQPYRLIYYS